MTARLAFVGWVAGVWMATALGEAAAAPELVESAPAPVTLNSDAVPAVTYGDPLDRRLPDEHQYAQQSSAQSWLARGRLRPFQSPAADPRQSLASPTANSGGWGDPAPSAVPRLPAYTVVDSHLIVFRPRDLYTRSGMIAQSFHAHPGLLWGNAFHSNESTAYDAFQGDDWNATKSDYWQTAFAMAVGGDPAEGRFIVDAVNDEDVWMRAEASAPNVPTNDQFQVGDLSSDSKVLELNQVPVNLPLVRLKW